MARLDAMTPRDWAWFIAALVCAVIAVVFIALTIAAVMQR